MNTKLYIISDTALRLRDNGHMTCRNSAFMWDLLNTFLFIDQKG